MKYISNKFTILLLGTNNGAILPGPELPSSFPLFKTLTSPTALELESVGQIKSSWSTNSYSTTVGPIRGYRNGLMVFPT